ncbi:hypothetical protein FSP39_018461 [Pinctada imbricata]|uniref:Endosome-associated-trafficking regulator 1 n=1 Tax=Pinctada imbricata TaxID=66713 RepID=A0AA89BKZ1_PINIB|nr:hypothetical protein FSP39_018461 [Pinctada imbricata]
MAEGGGSDSDENPFSFKNFVQSKDDNKPKSLRKEKIDVLSNDSNLPDISVSSTRKEKKGQEKGKQNKKTKDQNPFSFKKFLESSSDKSSSKKTVRSARDSSHKSSDYSTVLPDFVQDHSTDRLHSSSRESSTPLYGLSGGQRSRSSAVNDLPDFDLNAGQISSNSPVNDLPEFVSENDTRHIERVFPDVGLPSDDVRHIRTNSDAVELPDFALSCVGNTRSGSFHSDTNGAVSDPDDVDFSLVQSSAGAKIKPSDRPGSSQALPDFLSDGVHKNTEHFSDGDFISHSSDNTIRNGHLNQDDFSSLAQENRRLREEVSRLQRELDQANREIEAETLRKHKMVKDMEVIQKKEAEETAALERMVQQVEANLSTTTQRAVAAENTVTKLQSEVKSLQNQVSRLRSENEALQAGDHGMADLKERTTYASQQLSSAATVAEQNLKQLLSGVENLKILAQVLGTIDKLSEQKEDSDGKT